MPAVVGCRSMSGVHLIRYGHRRAASKSKDFSVATPEEFVKRFGGASITVINKVGGTLHG